MSAISPNCKYTDELLDKYTLEFGNDILELGLAEARFMYTAKIQELYNTLLNNNTLTNFENCIRYIPTTAPTTAPSESTSFGVIIAWILLSIFLVLLLFYFGYKIFIEDSDERIDISLGIPDSSPNRKGVPTSFTQAGGVIITNNEGNK
jgi:hypothetical protein